MAEPVRRWCLASPFDSPKTIENGELFPKSREVSSRYVNGHFLFELGGRLDNCSQGFLNPVCLQGCLSRLVAPFSQQHCHKIIGGIHP